MLLGISVLTLIGTTEVPAYAGGSSSPTITAAPSSPTTADPLTWSFTSSAAATSCELDRGTTVVSALASCVSGDPSATFDVSDQPGGSYTLTVYDAAAADVVAGTPSDTSTVDVAPVAATVSRVTDSPGKNRSPEWTFDLPTGATAGCELDDSDGHAIDSQASCSSPYDGDLTGHDDGQYTLSVTATAGGVSGAAATSSYLLDTASPDAPTVTPPAATGHDTTPVFAVSGIEAGATVECTASAPDGSGVPVTGCATAPTLQLPPGSADGDYSLSVTQTDAAGNTSDPGTAVYTLDTVAPPAPSVTAPVSPSTDRSPSFTVTDTESGLAFHCSATGPSPVTVSSCGPTTTLDLASADNGSYVLSVTATDAAGNVSDVTTTGYRLDAVAPPAPSVVGPTVGRGRFPIYALADSQDDVTFSCTVDGPSTAHVSQCGVQAWLDLAGAVDGDYTVSVTATDPLGQSSLAGTATYRLDTVAPTPPVITPPDSPDSSLAPTFAVTDAEPDAFLLCAITGPSTVSVTHCSASTLLDLTGATDGTYTLSVTATDAAGNTSGASTSTYTLDTTPPPAPVVIAPVSPSKDLSPTFEISDSDATARLTCVLLDPLGAIVRSGTCPVTGSFDTTGFPDGTYVLVVTAADHADNTATASVTWHRDTTPPPAPVVVAPASPSRGVFAGFEISDAEATATLSCLMTAADGSVVVTGACPPDGNVDTTGFVDGTFSLSVTATDEVGNSSMTTVTWTRDTVAPPTPTVTAPASPSSDQTPTFTLADSEPDVTLTCVLIGPDGTTVVSNEDCPDSGSIHTSGSGDGTYTLEVTATDEAGNVSPIASATYILDTTAPPAPSVAAPTSPSHDRSPTFTVSDTEPDVSYACTVTGGSPVAVSGCDATTTLDLSAATDATYTLSVTATDAAGNISAAGSASYRLDSIAPPAPTLTAPGSPSQGRSPVFTVGDADSGVTLNCTVSPSAPVSDCNSAPALDLSAAADGSYTLSVTATDSAGNTSAATTASYTLDTTAPAVPTIVAPPSPSSDTTPDFWISDSEAGVALSCAFTSPDGTALSLGPCPAGGHFDTAGGGDGDYALTVMATDAAGNASSTTVTWTLDTTAPPAPIVVAPTSPGTTVTPTFTVSEAESAATLTCLFTSPGGQTVSSGACPPDGTFSTTGFADGVYTLVATATDAAGNATSTTVHWTRDTAAPPRPTVVAPASPGGSRSPSFTVSDTEAGVSYTCSTSPTVPMTSCGPTTTLDLSAAPNGPYAVTVVAVDAAGNASAGATASYTLDTTAPPTPVVTAPPSPHNGRSPSFTVTDSEPGVTFTCIASPVVPVSGCGPTAVLNLAGAADDTYTLSVTATDAAGNVSTAGTASYTLVTATPPTPVVVGPTSPGHTRSPSFTVTDSQPGLSYTCTVSPVVPISACGATTVLDLSAASDRPYTLSVVGTDIADNASLAGKASYVLDSLAPPTPTVSVSGSPGSSRFPTFDVSDTEPDVTFSCTASPAVPITACDTISGLDLSGQPDGSYQLSVTATDPAGNDSAPQSATYVLDTSAPPSPTVTPTAASGQARRPIFTVSDTEPGVTLLCAIAPTGIIRTCGAATTLGLSGVPDGTYTLSVSAMDAAGNVSAATAVTYTLDTTAPPAPVLVAPASPGSTRAPVFGVSDTEPGVSFSCSVAPAGTVTTCGPSTTLGLTGAPDGTYTVSVTATDADGNVSPAGTATYRLDTTAPSAPSVIPLVAKGNSLSPAFTVTSGETGLTYTCTTSPLVTVTTCGASTVLDLTGDADGSYQLTVTGTDAAGNVSAPGSGSYTLDTTPPPVPTVTLTTPSSPGNSRTPTFTVADGEVGVTLSCTVSPTVAISKCGASTKLDLTGAPDVTYTVSVTATDKVGNVSSAGSATYQLDTTPPATPLIVAPLLPSSNTKPVFLIIEPGIFDPGVTLGCVLTSPSGATVFTGPCPTSGRFDTAGNGDGRYVLVVTASDPAGNTASASAFYLLDTLAPPPPTVTVAATGNSVHPRFSFSEREAGTTLSCVLTASNGHVVASVSPCASPYDADLSGLADDSYTLSVTATDAAGNNITGSATYKLDTQPPPSPVVTAPPSPAQGHPPVTFGVTESEPGTTFTCSVSPTVPIGGSCGSAPTLDFSGAPDGPYVLSVTVTDAAGNASTGTATYVLDTTPPPAPSIAVPRSPSNSTAPQFTVTDGEPGVGLHCTLVDPDGRTVTSQCPTGQVDLSGRSDGTYTLSAFATDAATNVSATVTATYVLDTAPPPAPTVIQSTPLSSRTTAFWQWRHDPTEFDPADDTADCVLSGPGGFVNDLGSCPSPDAFTTKLTAGEGIYTLTVTLTDEAGNTSRGSATYDFDRSAGLAPVVILRTPAGGIGHSRHPVWFLVGGNGATLTCQLFRGDEHGTPISPATACSMPTMSYSLKGLADGNYTLNVTAQEVDGTTVKPGFATYLLDTTAPHTPKLLGGTPSPSTVTTPQWSFELPPDATAGRCEWTRNGTRLATQTHCRNSTTLSLAGLGDGAVTIRVFAIDVAGNVSRPLVITYVLDRNQPGRPQVSPPTGSGPTAEWTVRGDPGNTLVCTLLSGGHVVVAAEVCENHPTYLMGDRPSGTYTLSATQTDAAGSRSLPGQASWLWANPGGSGPTNPGGGDGPGPTPGQHGHHGPPNPGLVGSLPKIVQHVIHKLGHVISHPVAPVRHLAHIVVPVPNVVSHAVQSAISAVGQAGGGTGFPLILIGLVIVFLAVQNRIDRRDPKLAFVSVAADDLVEFLPPPSREDGA